MGGITSRAGRIAAATAAALGATLTVGVTAAQADAPVRRYVNTSSVLLETRQSTCSATAVWGVAAGEGSAEYRLGNYQVCWYPSSVAGSGLDFHDLDPDVAADIMAQFRSQAPETQSADWTGYCPYHMPAGPDRAATITYRVKKYTVTAYDSFADGHKVTYPAHSGTYIVQPTIAWNPGCWT